MRKTPDFEGFDFSFEAASFSILQYVFSDAASYNLLTSLVH